MNPLPKQILPICACLFALTGHALPHSPDIPEPMPGSLSDADNAYANGVYAKALKLYRSLAEQGDVKAQMMLGSMYDSGLGISQDMAEAAKWYLLAAKQGDARAQSKIGSMYDIGLGVVQDYAEALKWWRLAAEQGDAFSQLNLGAKYDRGRVIPQDFKEAVKWYRLAVEQGNAFAQEKLAWKYILGNGVPQDDVLAYMWLDISASNDRTPGGKIAACQRGQQRDAIARRMTAEQIAKARELARKCLANKFHGC